MRVLVLGTPEHEGTVCGSTFERLGTAPTYRLEGLPHVLDEEPRPDVIVVTREWSIAIRAAVARARRRQIPVVYVMDGVIEWSYVWDNQSYVGNEGTVLQPLLADHLCVIGRHPARILSGLGLGERLHVVGLPRLDRLDRRRVVDPAAAPHIVIATARTPAHNVEQKVLVRRALRDLKGWFDRNPFARPVWRIAPELAAELGVTPDTGGSLVSVLRHSQALVSFTSTTLLEGMLLGLPTAQVDYRAVPQYVQTAWEIRSCDQIDGVLQSLLHPRPERLAFQDCCLRDELEPGDASERLAAVLQAAAAGPGREPEMQDTALQDGRLDFQQAHTLSAFAVSPLTVAQYELDATSKLLDLATPEILRLRAEADQLRDEVERLRDEAARAHRTVAERDAMLNALKLQAYEERLKPLVRALTRARIRRVTVYGAGEVGRVLVRVLRAARIQIVRVVDRDAALWGTTLDGVPVTNLEACLNDRTPVVAIASFAFAHEMRKAVLTVFRGRKVRTFTPRS